MTLRVKEAIFLFMKVLLLLLLLLLLSIVGGIIL